MEYVARHYIPLKKGLVTPGEILSDLPEEIISRLLEKGAIEEIAPVSAAAPDREPEEAEAEEAEAEEAEAEEAEAEEAEVEEIDALEGVVTAPKEEPKPRTRKGSKAKGDKA